MRSSGACTSGSRRPAAIVVVVVAAVVVALAYVVAVGTTFGLRVDAAAVPDPATGGVFRAVLEAATRSVNPVTGLLAGALILVLARRRSRGAMYVVASMMAGSVLTAIALESALADADPLGTERHRGLGSGFFPSGHSAAAMALTLAAILATTDRRRVAAAGAGAGAAGLLGIGNLVTQSHYPSDVVGGYLVAAAWGAVGIAILPSMGGPAAGPAARAAWAALAAGLVIPAIIAAGFVLERPETEEVHGGFVAAAAGVALTATAIAGSFVALARSSAAPPPAEMRPSNPPTTSLTAHNARTYTRDDLNRPRPGNQPSPTPRSETNGEPS